MSKKFNCYNIIELAGGEKLKYYIMAPNDRMAFEFALSEARGSIIEILRTHMDCFIIDYKLPQDEDNFESTLFAEVHNLDESEMDLKSSIAQQRNKR